MELMERGGRRNFAAYRLNLGTNALTLVPKQPAWRQVTLIVESGVINVFPQLTQAAGAFSMGVAGTTPNQVQFLMPPDVELFAVSAGAGVITAIVISLPDEAIFGAAMQGRVK